MANYHRPKDEIKLVLPVVDKEEKSAARISILRASITIYAKGIASFRRRGPIRRRRIRVCCSKRIDLRVDLLAERIKDFGNIPFERFNFRKYLFLDFEKEIYETFISFKFIDANN